MTKIIEPIEKGTGHAERKFKANWVKTFQYFPGYSHEKTLLNYLILEMKKLESQIQKPNREDKIMSNTLCND